jgi:hypothetical protein
MNADECLSQYKITTRVGHQEIAPGEGTLARVLTAVENSNARGRLPGLPDDLNPVILDAEKVKAFLNSLPAVPANDLERLRDRILYLNSSGLQLGSASAITPSILRSGYRLHVTDGPAGKIADVRLEAPIDKGLARARATKAKDTVGAMNREVEALEQKKKAGADSELLIALSTAQRKRYAAASVWRDLTKALAALEPENSELQAEAKAAKEAASKYIVAPWTGMP